MSSQADLIGTFLTVTTNELTAHGVMLFAGFTASFAFLKLVYDFDFNKMKKWEVFWRKILFLLFQGGLLSFPIYLLVRLRYYGALLYQINIYDSSIFFRSYTDAYHYFNGLALNELDGVSYWLTWHGLWPRIIVIILMGMVASIFLLLPKIVDKCTYTFFIGSFLLISGFVGYYYYNDDVKILSPYMSQTPITLDSRTVQYFYSLPTYFWGSIILAVIGGLIFVYLFYEVYLHKRKTIHFDLVC